MNTLVVGSKEFRMNFTKYQKLVEKGLSITIVNRSKAIFKIEPVDLEFDREITESLLDYENGKKFAEYDEVFTKTKK